MENHNPLGSRDGEEAGYGGSDEDKNTTSDEDDYTMPDEETILKRQQVWDREFEKVDRFIAEMKRARELRAQRREKNRRDQEAREEARQVRNNARNKARNEVHNGDRFKYMYEHLRVTALDARIAALFQHHPKINRFCNMPKRGLPCTADVKHDLEVLEYLSTTRRALLQGLNIPFSEVEKDFEERYKLHPSVFKESPSTIPKEVRKAIDFRSDGMGSSDFIWTRNVDFREKVIKELGDIIDSWLNSTKDQPYPAEQARKTVDEICRTCQQIVNSGLGISY